MTNDNEIPTNIRVEEVRRFIEQKLEEIKKECFKPEMKITFVARNTKYIEGEIVLTEDPSLDKVIALLERWEANPK